jgi:hypothetical protein
MGILLLKGPSIDGLYPIKLPSASLWHNVVWHFVEFLFTVDIWHAQLRHASSPVVSRVLRSQHLPVSSLALPATVCEFCQSGKAKQMPFSASTLVSSSPLDLVHSDVWTFPLISLSGCRYYVIFIDDFTRFCWLNPLSKKFDVFPTFVKFKTLVENQFPFRIKQFQSENGGEFLYKLFTNFLDSHGILHRLSCPYMSQQNGLAERKQTYR